MLSIVMLEEVLNPSFIINLMRNGRKNNRKSRAFHGNWLVQLS